LSVFLFVVLLFIYMVWINFRVLNKFGHKKLLTSVGAFFDMMSNLIGLKFENLISICFTAGVIIFVTYIIARESLRSSLRPLRYRNYQIQVLH
jgi:hypothetical protein